MKNSLRFIALTLLVFITLAITACNRGPSTAGGKPAKSSGESHSDKEASVVTDTNRVSIPASVRSNLGISFARVERRRVEHTLRVPGRFEYLPTARREYRTPVPGRVDLLVEQFQSVNAGDPLYRLDSPAWRELQGQLTEADANIERLATRLASYGPLRKAHHAHENQLQETIDIRKERVAQLERLADAGGGRLQELTAARDAMSAAQADLTEVLEKEATLEAEESESRSDLAAARKRRDFLLEAASSIVSIPRDELVKPVESEVGPEPVWATIKSIEVRATEDGVVEMLGQSNGSWADEKAPVLTVVKPERLRFRASGLQSDLGVLRDGLEARIVPPTPTAAGRAVPLTETMSGTLTLGLAGDPNDRTLELFVQPTRLESWARSGVSAQLEIVTDATSSPELAIPLAAVQRDGMTPIIFRRNPRNPDEVIRMEADLGMNDGRWVALLSGVRDGDEIALDGAFQLMLSTSGGIQKGGHFHADGTFHEGED